MLKKGYQVSLFMVVCILINYGLKMLTSQISAPLWLDSVGTAIAAYVLGPVCGAIAGACVNIAFGFRDPISFLYAITNVAVGLSIGICARRKMMEKLFDVITACAIVTFSAALISTTINCIFYAGSTGNEWGDGILRLLTEWKIPWVASAFIAEFFLDFLDKFATLLILYFMIIGYRMLKKRWSKQAQDLPAALWLLPVIAMTVLLPARAEAMEAQNDYRSYIQTVYNNSNGLMSGEANDIASTDDGIIWIGTYAGLYRYSGKDFQYINYFDTVKNVNCLYVDEEGRLWIGTNDDGLSIVIDGEVVNNFSEDNGLPSNSVRSIVQKSNGEYFVGTSGELVVLSLVGGANILRSYPEIHYATCMSADENGNVAIVTANGNLYVVDGEARVTELVPDSDETFSCCEFGADGRLYVGNYKGMIRTYLVTADGLVQDSLIKVGNLYYINSLKQIETGEIFVCADEGIGWLDEKHQFHAISTETFNSSIDNMTVDYQGNLWFSSSRLGVLKLCQSAFTEIYPSANLDAKVVNTIARWNGNLYFGTDSGLDVIHETTGAKRQNALTAYLDNARIRCLYVDSKNRLWVCANGFGVFCVNNDGGKLIFNQKNGALGNFFRNSLELSDGTMAVASDLGVTFIQSGVVTGTVGEADGLTNSLVLCMIEMDDGRLLAGTDGGGIAVIENQKLQKMLTRADGLGSGVILRMAKDCDNGNLFIATSNGICYLEEGDVIRELDTFPYSNNYDLLDCGDGKLYATGSAGIYVVNKAELLAGGQLTYENLNYLNGLRGSFTANAWNYLDEEGNWYIAGGRGVTKFSRSNYNVSQATYRMLVSSVVLDDTVHFLHGERQISIPRGVTTLQITPEIINYSAIEPFVSYYMEGLGNEEKTVLLQKDLESLLFTNLDAGTYRFHLSILDQADGNPIEEQVYTIVKEAEINDYLWFKLYFFLELIFIVAWLSWFITRTLTARKLEFQRKEIALAKEQVRMGNETILAIARTVDAKDNNTSQHSTRVSEYSVMIAKNLGYTPEEQENLRKAALLHDIGKIGIPDRVLNKPARLTDDEYAIMKSHVTRGAEILKDFTLIPNVQEGALYHHERYDGTGYAQGLKGKDIPEAARIIGIADAFDAMTANRVYRNKLDFDTVLSELRRGRGKQFDPDILDVFLGLIESGQIDRDKLYENSQPQEGDKQ